MAILQELKIGGNDYSSYVLEWEVHEEMDSNITSCKILFTRKVPAISEGSTITIKRGTSTATDEFVFNGRVEEVIKNIDSVEVAGKDMLADLIKAEVTKSFDKNVDTEAGKISAMFLTLINTYGGGTLTADSSSVQDSGTVIILDKFVCNHEDVYKKCQELADMIDWQFYYKASTGLVYFEPKGYLGQNGTLTVGVDLEGPISWKTDSTELMNDLTVFGVTVDIETTETGQLGVTSGWTAGDGGLGPLNKEPVSTKVYADAANPPTTLRVGGVENSTSGYDYKVDKKQKRLVWETANGYAWSANHYVEVRYTHSVPVPVTGKNAVSIALYDTPGSSSHKKTIFADNIHTVADAEKILSQKLSMYSLPFISTVAVPISRIDLKVGQTVQVVDSSLGEDTVLLVNAIKKNWPKGGDELSLGDKEWKTADWQTEVMDRILEIEANQAIASDFLVHVFDSSRDQTLERRYFKKLKSVISGANTVAIHSNPAYNNPSSDWGLHNTDSSYVHGTAPTYSETDTTVFLQPGNNAFKEFFYDTAFIDTNDGVLDTSTHRNTFSASGQVLLSGLLAIGTTYSWALLEYGTVSGSGTFEISADNKAHWQTLTEGVPTTLTYSDALGFYYRYTASEAGYIESTKTTGGKFSAPAIKLTLGE